MASNPALILNGFQPGQPYAGPSTAGAAAPALNAGLPGLTTAVVTNIMTNAAAAAASPADAAPSSSDLVGTMNFLLDDVLGLDHNSKLVDVVATRGSQNGMVTVDLKLSLGAWPKELIDSLPTSILSFSFDPQKLATDHTYSLDVQKEIQDKLDGFVTDYVNKAVGSVGGVEHAVAVTAGKAIESLLKSEIMKPLSGELADSLLNLQLPNSSDITSILGNAFDKASGDYFKQFVPDIAKTYAKLGLSEILTTTTSGLDPTWATAIKTVGSGVLNPILDNIVTNYFAADPAHNVDLLKDVDFEGALGKAIAGALVDFKALDKTVVDDILGIDGHGWLDTTITGVLNNGINTLVNTAFVDAVKFLAGDFDPADLATQFSDLLGQFAVSGIQDILNSFIHHYDGTALAELFVNIDSLPEEMVAKLGSWIGSNVLGDTIGSLTMDAVTDIFGEATAGAIGANLFNGLGALLGAGVGAIAGSVVFELLDNLFDGAISGFFNHVIEWIQNDSPQAFFGTHYDPTQNVFVHGAADWNYSKDSNDQMRAAVKALSDAYTDRLNTVLTFIGQKATIDATYESMTFAWGKKHYDSKYAAFHGAETNRIILNGDPSSVVLDALGAELQHINFHSGNAIISQAYDMWKAEVAAGGGGDLAFSTPDAFDQLQNLIGLAKFANDYRQDPTLFDQLMAGDSAAAVTILQEYLQAQSLGFNDPITLYGSIENREEIGSAAAGDTIVLDGIAWKATARGGNDTVFGGVHDDLISGGTGDDLLYGNVGADTISGDEGNDTIYGGDGKDTIHGGIGDDLATGDADDDLIDGGDGNDKLYGGAGNDHLIGGTGNDLLQGDAGDDLVEGGDGADQLFGFDGKDTLNGGAGDDLLYGENDNDVLNGDAGNDQLDGGAGADTMYGGAGDDSYVVDNAGDRVIENAGDGVDKVFSTVDFSLAPFANVENLTLTGSALRATGNAGVNTLTGNDLGNVLDGGGGGDTLIGGLGSDVYYVRNAADKIVEAAGGGTADTALAAVSYALNADAQVERLAAADANLTNAINLTGNAWSHLIQGNAGINTLTGGSGADTLYGYAGNDRLNGGAGVDNLYGGLGDDTYVVDNAGDHVVENAGEGIDTIEASISFVLNVANVENVTLSGTAAIDATGDGNANVLTGNNAANTLSGAGGNDTLYGGGGGDRLDGGAGADTMYGGTGDDSYVVDNAGDRVLENAGEGTDTVLSSVDFSLAAFANVENLTLTGSALRATGNAGANTLTGDDLGNVLDGGGGGDTLKGGAGNDVYYVRNAADVIVEGAGQGTADTVLAAVSYTLTAAAQVERLAASDANATTAINLTGNAYVHLIQGNAGVNTLTGGTGNDSLYGYAGDDRLDGGQGMDTLYGGIGNDIYVVDSLSDVIVENAGEGTDTVEAAITYSLAAIANVENLTLTGVNAINGTGNALDNVIHGNSAANTLNGGGGTDMLYGGAGDDIYVIGDAHAKVIELAGEGNDTVQASVSYSLVGMSNIETLMLTGTGYINATGNAEHNTLIGNAVSNVLDGGGGGDTLQGGAGNDVYYVRSAGDVIVEGAGEGTADTVLASVSYTLAAAAQVERLAAADANATNAMTLTGNAWSHTIQGNNGVNMLTGGSGADTLYGYGGDDRIDGGLGNDTIYAGPGNDIIVFGHGTGQDTIGDFVPGADKIDLTAIGYTWQQVQNSLHQNGADLTIDLGNGDVVMLKGVSASQLHQGDFVLASGSAAAMAFGAHVATFAAPAVEAIDDPAMLQHLWHGGPGAAMMSAL